MVKSGDGSGQVTGPARGQVRQVVRPGKGSGQAGRWSGPVQKSLGAKVLLQNSFIDIHIHAYSSFSFVLL